MFAGWKGSDTITELKESRLPWKILQWDILEGKSTWFSEIVCICMTLEITIPGVTLETYDMEFLHMCTLGKSRLEREEEAHNKPKLRTYNKFKDFDNPLALVKANLPRFQRSILSKFICGIFPLELETGRYIGTPENQRLCRVCDTAEIENEILACI